MRLIRLNNGELYNPDMIVKITGVHNARCEWEFEFVVHFISGNTIQCKGSADNVKRKRQEFENWLLLNRAGTTFDW